MWLVAPLERCLLRACNLTPVRGLDLTSQTVLDVVLQTWVRHQLRRLWSSGHQFRLPLCDRSSIFELPATRCSVSSQLSRDRGRATPDTTGDLSHPDALGPQKSDLLSLGERQVSPGYGSRHEQWHPATMTEPAGADNLRHPDRFRGLLTGDPGRDLFPELSFDLTTKRRCTWQAHCSSPRQLLHPSRRSSHKHLHDWSVATTG